MCGATATAAAPPRIEHIGVSADGTPANANQSMEEISADGRYVVFSSNATNLVPGTTDITSSNIFVKDLRTGAVEQASVASDGGRPQKMSFSFAPSISADGRYVAFESTALDLAPGKTENGTDIFVRDRLTKRTELVVRHENGVFGNTDQPVISADGRYIAFHSERRDLIPGDDDGPGIFVKDLRKGTIRRVSIAPDGSRPKDASYGSPVISQDGTKVGFMAAGDDMGPGPDPDDPAPAPHGRPPTRWAGYVHDLTTGRTEPVSETPDGRIARVRGITRFSPDGQYALFSSHAKDLVPNDTNGVADVFARNLRTGEIRRLSLRPDGSEAHGTSYGGVLSADNRKLFFGSYAPDLAPGDTRSKPHLFVRDLRTGAVDRIDVRADGDRTTDGTSSGVHVDRSGKLAVFANFGLDLVTGQANERDNLYLRRLD
ncbi:hypothetical protein AF335_24635 [Streptomyces eurocidicus]|uniref:WD40 domain protein beta propeller n=1 Tax=Streptomyces eurocidicus TaxID=66423 RepID=A0A2N8NR42_STREU|nr:hypothetical protein AF335_24635 [Streptomyces eurocidicus]